MDKILRPYFIFAALLAVTLCACAVPAKKTVPEDKLLVYASFYPVYDLAQKAAGDFAEIRCLIPGNTTPHDWEPSPRDIAGLKDADLFFYSGGMLEGWIPSVLEGLGGDAPPAVETALAAQGAEAVPRPGIADDSHVWLSPKIAKLQFAAICGALKEKDPQNAAEYDKNYKKYEAEFDRLSEEFDALKSTPKKLIVVTHGAFGYLCREYGLKQLPITGLSSEDEPDPAKMAQVVEIARENDVTVVFYEQLASAKIAQAAANELGAKILPISALEGLSEEERANGDDYFSLMRRNLASLKEALAA